MSDEAGKAIERYRDSRGCSISGVTYLVFRELGRWHGKNGQLNVSQKRLAKTMRLCERTIRNAFRKLKEKHLLHVVQYDQGLRNAYIINLPGVTRHKATEAKWREASRAERNGQASKPAKPVKEANRSYSRRQTVPIANRQTIPMQEANHSYLQAPRAGIAGTTCLPSTGSYRDLQENCASASLGAFSGGAGPSGFEWSGTLTDLQEHLVENDLDPEDFKLEPLPEQDPDEDERRRLEAEKEIAEIGYDAWVKKHVPKRLQDVRFLGIDNKTGKKLWSKPGE